MRVVNRGDALPMLCLMPPKSVGAIITDPPALDTTEARRWVQEFARILRFGGALVVMADGETMTGWAAAVKEEWGWLSPMADMAVMWLSRPGLESMYLPIRWWSRNGARSAFNTSYHTLPSNVLVAHRVPFEEREHPQQKPVELTNFLISLLTEQEDLVVDPFAGSGSTLVSAELAGRDWLGADIPEEYAKVALSRALHADMQETRPLRFWVNGNLREV